MNNTIRLNYLDALRGLAIFLVVVSHVGNFTLGIKPYDSYWNHFICTFYLPLFFFISGFLAYKSFVNAKGIFVAIKNKVLSLLVPLLLFLCIHEFVSGNYNPLPMIFVYDGMFYWFLLVLFEIFVTYYIVCLISLLFREKQRDRFIITSLVILSISLIAILVLCRSNGGRVWNVLCIENYTKYFQFFAFGVICKKFSSLFFRIIGNQFFLITLILTFLLSSIIIHWPIINNSFILYSLIHDEIVRYAGVLTMFIIFYQKRAFFESNSKLAKFGLLVGRRSLDIYLLEGYFRPELCDSLGAFFSDNSNFGLEILTTIGIALFVVLISLLCSEIIRTSKFAGKLFFGSR